MDFRVLGPLEALEDDEPLRLGGAKQRALLAILLLNANEVVSADRLIDELWGAKPPKTAAKSLQVLVSQLRRVLEPDRATGESGRLLITRAPGYLLRVEPEYLDLERFQRRAREGHEALAASEPERAATILREALAEWRGVPLADLAYADFAQREASRLQESRLAALEDRIQADLECERHAEVIGELEQLVAEEPLRERPRAQLMLALYRSGRQADALDVYAAARRALVDELGIEPGRELKEIQAAILEHDPALEIAPPASAQEPPATQPDGAAAAAPSEVFVGRERELAEFRSAFDDAVAGRMSLLLIAGEPGIGKSRLADELTSLAQARASVCWGRCWEAGGAPAYWPWVQALRGYIRDGEPDRIREELAPGASDIAQMLPELHELFPDLAPAPSLDPEGARFRLFDSTASFLRAAGEAQPVVLVLDDLHAADEPSLLLLRFLAHSLHDARVIVIGTYRDTEAKPGDALTEAVAEARREPVTRTVRLGGLAVSEVAQVIDLITSVEASDELAAAIHRETEGNPLFVGELVRLLDAEGRLEEVAKSPWDSSIPQGVRDVIGHRLRHLSEDCKRLLSVASVLGRDFSLDALGRVSERPSGELLDLLDEAQAARVVGDQPTGRAGFRFSHALIRDSLYDDLGTGERLRLHRSAAEALDDLYAADPEPHLAELAYHYYEAASGGDAHKAIKYARGAGDHAAAILAYEEAARLYRMGLEALELERPADETIRCELLLALGDAEARGGDVATAKETFVRAADLARSLSAPEQLARAALGYGGRWIWFRAGKDQRLIALLEDALAALPKSDNALRAMLLARLAGALRDHPVPERRASLSSEALEIARRLDDRLTLAYALDGTYSAFTWPKDADEWLAMARELTQLADEIGDKERGYISHFHALGALMMRGDLPGAEIELAALASLAQELRQPSQVWVALTAEAMLNLFTGRLGDAEILMGRAAELGSGAQGLDATYYYVINLQGWALRRAQGRLAEVEASLEGYVEEYPGVFIFRCVLASVYSELGHEQRAQDELAGLAADNFAYHVGTEWFFGASLLAGVCATLRNADHAEPLYEALLPTADYNVYAHPEAALGSASRYLGLLAMTLSRWEEAEAHFERALGTNAAMGARPWVAETQRDYARMLVRRAGAGDEARARELLQAAARGYQELGMESWQATVATDLTAIPRSA